jgi:cytochrome c oxidase accessory protein FixG
MARPLPTPVVTDDGEMYQSATKIHPHEIDGRFQRLRRAAVFWLLGMFYLFPWLNWGDRQSVLFDLPARQFHVFGLTLFPQDFIYLAMMMMIAAFSLFFFTAIAGRLWCGYACPQTVWTETFLWIERWTEGTRNQRIKLDAARWGWDKLRRKAGKQFLWITFALWTGFTFVGFFTPIRDLGVRLVAFDIGPWETFWVVFYGLATYGNAGFLREQVCKYMCPYARFQGAMFDRDTLVIGYDTARGEPRGSRRKSVPSVLARAAAPAGATATADVGAPPALGDCIDCTLCVQVCPTGIDIRRGLQYECIACGACIDACDSVMDKMGYPRGLVRYATENAFEGGRERILRPRVFVYAALLLALSGGFAWSLWHRTPLIVDVVRDRNALYREVADGRIENAYTLKLVNQDGHDHQFEIAVESTVPLRIGHGQQSHDSEHDAEHGRHAARILHVEVDEFSVREVPITLSARRGDAGGRIEVTFVVTNETDRGVSYRQRSSFIGPP